MTDYSSNTNLFDKNIPIKNSLVYQAHTVLRYIAKQKTKKVSLYSLLNVFKGTLASSSPKQFFNVLFFLKMSGIIKFNKPYIEIENDIS